MELLLSLYHFFPLSCRRGVAEGRGEVGCQPFDLSPAFRPEKRPLSHRRGEKPKYTSRKPELKKTFFVILIIFLAGVHAQLLQFEGILPPDVDKSAMTAEYFRLYRVLAPRQRPDARPLRIVYLSPKESAVREYGLPEWGGGGALGRDLIVVPTAAKPFLDQSFAQITRHELAHIVLNRAYPNVAVPRWFHEGVAMTLSGELSLPENVIVSEAIFANRLMALSSIDSVNSFGRNRADLAYCQSHLSLLFLIDQYGIDVVAEILSSAKKTGSFWQGVNAVLSITPQEFETLVQSSITTRYRLVFLIADYPAFWVGIVFLFLVASLVTVIRKRKALDSMERQEQADDALESSPKHSAEIPGNGSEDEWLDEDEYDDEDEYMLRDGIELEDDDEDDDLRPPEEPDKVP